MSIIAQQLRFWGGDGETDSQRTMLDGAAEVDRLTAALEQVAILGEQGMTPDYTEWLTFHDKVAQIARTALNHQQSP